MKRILTILLIVMMVFSITGCDPEGRAKMADFMGKMGENVMGADTSKADAAADAAKVTTVDKPKVGESVKLGNSDVQMTAKKDETTGKVYIDTITVGNGVAVKLPKEAKVESVLPPISKESKATVVSGFRGNQQTKDKVMAEMATEITGEVKTATQGTAKVMEVVLQEMKKEIPAVEGAVGAKINDALDSIEKSLKDIQSSETVTQADVTALQMVQDFANTVYENKDKMSDPATIPQEVIQSAGDLLTVSEAISAASKFTLADIGGEIAGLTKNVRTVAPGMVELPIDVSPDVQKYINTAYNVVDKLLADQNFETVKKGFNFHKMGYENYANMVSAKLGLNMKIEGTGDAKKVVGKDINLADLAFNGKDDKKVFDQFIDVEHTLQYAIAAVFSEGDDYYRTFKSVLTEIENNEAMKSAFNTAIDANKDLSAEEQTELKKAVPDFVANAAAAGKVLPENIKELINVLSGSNDWVAKPGDATVKIQVPVQYEAFKELDPKLLGIFSVYIINGDINDAVKGATDGRIYFKGALNTLNNVIAIGPISDMAKDKVDLNLKLTEVIEKFYGENK